MEVWCSISLVLSVILIILESCSTEQRKFPARFVLYYTISLLLVDSTILWGAFLRYKDQVQAVHNLCRVQGAFLQFVNWNCLGWWSALILVLYRGVVLDRRFQPSSEKLFFVAIYGTSLFFTVLPLVLELTYKVQIYSTIYGGTAVRWCWLNSQCWMATIMFAGAEVALVAPFAVYAALRAGYALVYNPSLYSYASKKLQARLFVFVLIGIGAYAAIFLAGMMQYFQTKNSTYIYADYVSITALGGLGVFNFLCFAPKHLCPSRSCCFCCFPSLHNDEGRKEFLAEDSEPDVVKKSESDNASRKSSGSFFKFSTDDESVSSSYDSLNFGSSRPTYGATNFLSSEGRGPSKPYPIQTHRTPSVTRTASDKAVYLIGEDDPITPVVPVKLSSSI